MNYPPSAVNVANVGRAIVPSNARELEGIKELGRTVGAGVKKYRTKKEAASLVDQIYGGKDKVIEGAQAQVADEGFMSMEYTPEQEQAAIQSEQIDLQEKQQAITVKEQATQNRENVRQNFNLQSIMGDEDAMKAFIRLREIDPNAASGLLDVAKYNSAQDNAFVKKEATEALGHWTNARNMIANGNFKGAQDLISSVRDKRLASDKDASRANGFLSITNQDEASAYVNTTFAIAGGAIEALSATEKLNLEKTQTDIDLNKQKLAQDGMTPYQVAQINIAQKKAEQEANPKPLDHADIRGVANDVGKFIKPVSDIYAAAKALDGLGKAATNTDKVAIVFKFMKALDPNSSVRESEVGMIEGAGGVNAQLAAIWNNAIGSGGLTEDVINNITDTAKGLANTAIDSAQGEIDGYLGSFADMKDDTKNRQRNRLPERFAESVELPQGVTEEDIQLTMKNNGMTREQVMEKLKNG